MGQPGNTSINHAGSHTYWNYPYNSIKRTSSSNHFFFFMLKQMYSIFFKFTPFYYGKEFISPFFIPTYEYDRKVNEERWFKEHRVFDEYKMYSAKFKQRRRQHADILTKFSIFRFHNIFLIKWIAYKTFILEQKKKGRRFSKSRLSLKFRKVLYLKYISMLNLKDKGYNLNYKII